MHECAAFEDGRNWVGVPVPRAVLSTSLYQVQKQKGEFLAYISSDN